MKEYVIVGFYNNKMYEIAEASNVDNAIRCATNTWQNTNKFVNISVLKNDIFSIGLPVVHVSNDSIIDADENDTVFDWQVISDADEEYLMADGEYEDLFPDLDNEDIVI